MKRPWNRTHTHIYSLLTNNHTNDFNMNICTYVSVVNMNPRMYAISIDYNTKTYTNLMESNSYIVLQALSIKNIDQVVFLGKKTGHTFDKAKYLVKNNLITNWKDHKVLKETSFYIELQKVNKIYEMKDHALFLFKIKSFKNLNNRFLTLNHLIEKKIIL